MLTRQCYKWYILGVINGSLCFTALVLGWVLDDVYQPPIALKALVTVCPLLSLSPLGW